MSDELFEDVKAADRVGKSLVPTSDEQAPRIVAAERGQRRYPSGTVEDYERIEFEHRDR